MYCRAKEKTTGCNSEMLCDNLQDPASKFNSRTVIQLHLIHKKVKRLKMFVHDYLSSILYLRNTPQAVT